ncbi:MAG: DMT family transporter [Blastocatellia bacterium]
MKTGWLLMALVTGFLIPAQATMNARMRTFVLHPMYGSLVNFAVGGIALLTITCVAIVLGQSGYWRGALQAPWWAWCGGLIGAMVVVVGIQAVPNIGAANFSVAIIAGQLFGALLLDQFGWLGLPVHQVSAPRLLGAAFLLLGVWLVQRY